MKAVILAAGRGSRLHPFTEDCPKCLTELGGITLLDRQVATLRGAGVTDIVVVTGYLSERVTPGDTRQVHNDMWETTNMVESLFCAEDEFGNDVIVSYGDIVYEPRVLDTLLRSPHNISVVVDWQWRAYWERRFDDPLSDAESLRLDDAGLIVDIGGEAADIDDIQAQYIGLMRFRGAGIGALTAAKAGLGEPRRPWMDDRPVSQAYMTDLLMEMILKGEAVHAIVVEAGWLEIDTPKDYEIAAAVIGDGPDTTINSSRLG